MSDLASTQSANKAARTLKTSGTVRMLNRAGVFLMVGVLFLIGAAFFRERFLSADSLLTILRQITQLGIIAIGVSFVTCAGRYVDLSIPSTVAAVGFVTLEAQNQGMGFAASLLCGLGTGVLIGGFNGWMVGYLRLNPILWTLAMNFLLMGILKQAFSGVQSYPSSEPGSAGDYFKRLSEYELFGRIPLATVVLFLLMPLCWWLMRRTNFGRKIQMVGAAYEPARLSGIDARRTILLAFALSGLLTACAAVFIASKNQKSGFDLGAGLDFSAITAVVIGGVTLAGGVGTVTGVIGGVLLVGILNQLVTLAKGDVEVAKIVNGVIFIAVVGLTSWLGRKGGRSNG